MRASNALIIAVAANVLACAGTPPPPPTVVSTPSPPSPPQKNEENDLVESLRRACDGGNGVSCNNLALEYLEGRAEAAPNPTRAAALLRRACDLRSAAGCGNLGWLYLQDTPFTRDPIRAAGLLTEACDGSFWLGCAILADIRVEEGPQQDFPAGIELYERACGGGHQPSCGKLGTFYQAGVGVKKDEERARALLEPSCKSGFALACTGVGTLHLHDDPRAAVEAYERGCADTNPTGCYVFGLMCTRNLAERCADRADALLQRACDMKHPKACALLASRKSARP